MEQDNSIPQAFGEWIIFECQAARKGDEVKSAGGIVTGKRTDGDVPLYGKVVSVGGDCPDDIQTHLMGKNVNLPNGKINNIPDPRVAFKEIPLSSVESRIFVATHWKNIQAIYYYEPTGEIAIQKPAEEFKSSLITMASASDLKSYS